MSRGLAPWSTSLRPWQRSAWRAQAEAPGADFLLVATPGAGKTTAALRCAHDSLRAGQTARLVVVCPTNHLRRQWAEAAGRAGIQLDPSVAGDGVEGREFHGMVVTYQQVCGHAAAVRSACATRPTFVVLDEVHHAGDGRGWGDALRLAFGDAARRLALSGTPFRSDAATIPFVRYHHGVSVADFTYGYDAALRDHVCRPVYFATYGGLVTWQTGSGLVASASFRDRLPDPQQRERLKAAILHADWTLPVLRAAHGKLLDLRRQHPDAGGLVIASGQDHARAIAGLLRHGLGVDADLAVSDDPAASRVIHRFARSTTPWLVAVNMVSEGVDIPRLRVGVFLTNVLTELYFRQVVGRFVRRQPHLPGPQRAFVYLPADPVLSRYAAQIAEERDHVLDAQAPPPAAPPPSARPGPGGLTLFRPLHAQAMAHDLIATAEPPPPAPAPTAPAPTAAEPLFALKDRLRRRHKTLVGTLARLTGRPHREIHADLIRSTGSRIETATVWDLERRITILEQRLAAASAARGVPIAR